MIVRSITTKICYRDDVEHCEIVRRKAVTFRPFTEDYDHNRRLKAKNEKRLGTCCETDIIIFREFFFFKNFSIECDLFEPLNM